MSLVNTVIQPFTVNAYRQGEFIEVTDADLRGTWNVLMFYPGDFTFVCPTELEDLADHYDEFQALGVEVYSASTDSHFSHKAWHDTSEAVGKVQYAMLGDLRKDLARNFDVLDEDALRGTPVLLGATGGTPRHALVTETAMRPLFTYLHAPAVTTALYAATEDWGAHASDSDGLGGARLGRRIRQGAEELLDALRLPAGTTEGGGVGREDTTPGPDAAEDFPGFVDFETLLHRGGLR